MNKNIYFTSNSDEHLKRLEKEGYTICTCCRFPDTVWIHLYQATPESPMTFHGVGFSCENDCSGTTPEKCILCHLKGDHQTKVKENTIFNDIDELIKYLKEYEI